jgi:hypothetical protein
MLDDLERLRTTEPLRLLLAHYARLAEPTREIWHPRPMALDGVEAPELSKLHGLLIAMDCIELKVGEMAASYRVTPAGLRMLQQVEGSKHMGEPPPTVAKPAKQTPFRRKRENKPAAEAACAAS